MEQSEQQKFLEELEVKEDVFEKPLSEEVPEKEETEEEGFKAKNRREKRLLEQNQRLREEAIATTARLEGIKEAQSLHQEEPAEYLKRIEKIYGTNTPEAIEATNLLREALEGVRQSATEDAFKRLEEQKGSEAKAVQEEEKNLDEILDHVEDEHGIDMSGDDRTGFLTLLEKLSPKDSQGNIIEYADPDATAEFYLSRKEKTASRAKDLASRSMTRSGATQESKLMDDAAMRFLKENGII